MTIQSPRFQPAARPISTAVAAAPVFSAPAPVQAPLAPQPIMLQSSVPTPVSAADTSFMDALNAFGVSLGRAGNMLHQEYEEDRRKASNAAAAELAGLDTAGQDSYITRVQTEKKNKALVDGTMEAFGMILVNRIHTDPALADMNSAKAAEYVQAKAKEYSQQFNSDAFNKTFAPAVTDLVSQYKGKAVAEEHKAHVEMYIDGLVATAKEYSPQSVGLPPEQRTAAIQAGLDKTAEKMAADGTIEKRDATTVYKRIAQMFMEAGDQAGFDAVSNKKRGDQPALITFDDDVKRMALQVDDRRRALNVAHIEEVKHSLREDAEAGRLAGNKFYKLDRETLLKEYGIDDDRLHSLEEANKVATQDSAFIRNAPYVQDIKNAVDAGDITKLPAKDDPLAISIYGRHGIKQLYDAAMSRKADISREKSALTMQKWKTGKVYELGANLNQRTNAAWTIQDDVQVQRPDGVIETIKANDILDAGYDQAVATIEQKYGKDTPEAASAQAGLMIGTGYVPEKFVQMLKRGSTATTAAAIVEQNPALIKSAFDAQLQGLGFYKAFAANNGNAVLRAKIGDDAMSFYNNVLMVQNVMGTDDVSAIRYVATAQNAGEDVSRNPLNKLRLDEMKTKVASSAIEPIAAASKHPVADKIPGSGINSYSFVDNSFVTGLVSRLSEQAVRLGLDPSLATEGVSRYITNTFTSYKGMIVPKGGDNVYQEVQDAVVKKFAESNPAAAKAFGEVVLVPNMANNERGESGVHTLRSAENGGYITVPLKPMVFKARDGSDIVINNPAQIGLRDLHRIRDAMRFEQENSAYQSGVTDRAGEAKAQDRLVRYMKSDYHSVGDNWDKGFVDHLNAETTTSGVRSLSYAMSYYAKNDDDTGRKNLASALVDKLNKAGDANFSFIPKSNLRDGVNGITMKQDGKIAVGLHPKEINDTIVHEGVHAVLMHYMGNFNELRRSTDGSISMPSNWSESEKAGATSVFNVYEKMSAVPFSGKQPIWLSEARKDPDEFVARALTDKNFQEWMRTKPATPSKSLWDKFVDGAKRLILGDANASSKERNLLEDALEASGHLIRSLE